MVRRRSRRSARRARERARARVHLAAAALVICAFVGAALYPRPLEVVTTVPAPYDSSADAGLQADASPGTLEQRPVYRHSVVASGVYSAGELEEAIAADAVVAAHYAHLSPRHARIERVRADRLVYMSYRVGNRIYWTRRPVRLQAGEAIVSDGRSSIRARCGNCLSDTPMEPTSPEEPPEAEFDLFAEPMPPGVLDTAPVMTPDDPGFGQVPAGSGLLPPDVRGADWSDSPGGVLGSLAPPAGLAIPSAVIPSFAVPGGGPTRDAVQHLPSLTHPALTPEQPIPVPEPGTLLLLSSGLAAFGLRRLRQRR